MILVQWFGDLVTEVYWNDLWLAEGFATYWVITGLSHAARASTAHVYCMHICLALLLDHIRLYSGCFRLTEHRSASRTHDGWLVRRHGGHTSALIWHMHLLHMVTDGKKHNSLSGTAGG